PDSKAFARVRPRRHIYFFVLCRSIIREKDMFVLVVRMRMKPAALTAGWRPSVQWVAMSAVAVMGILVSACQDSEGLFDLDGVKKASEVTFEGCTGGYGVDATRILVRFSGPSGFSKMNIYRNG